ncbi:hypothetical protein H4Q32_020396 [Labeo rohita]|uniref:Uncharacterized protein n=1 Tax=Labeo rohita TaxID=84645 RepID=A0ABQ8LEN2_LABRO|nr:hypothetical protein H4Q32_020396 [Labeo rohita]
MQNSLWNWSMPTSLTPSRCTLNGSQAEDGIRKLQQKAVEQPEQKKSKSAEFLMERVSMEGAVNPAFQEDSEEESEMRSGTHHSTLAAQQQRVGLQAAAMARGNEGAQNYFDPSSAAEGDPRRCRMSGVGGRDELELSMVTSERAEYVESAAEDGWRDRQRAELLERRTEVIPQYVEQLRERVQRDMIPVSRLTLEQEEHSERGKTEEKVWARKQRVMSLLRGNSKVLMCVQKKERLLAENRLLNSLRQRQAEVINQYGEIIEETENTKPLDIESDLHWQVEWTRTPEPIEVLVLCLRAVREKLPRGLYSLSVSLQTRLGGRTLRWSRMQEQQWVGRTEPVEHQGRYFDIELNINQSLYMLPTLPCALASSVFLNSFRRGNEELELVGGKLQLIMFFLSVSGWHLELLWFDPSCRFESFLEVLPASCDLLPSSVLVFKLLSLPSDHSHVSSVVGWGAFPICDCSLQLFNGKFKTPLLRGSPNPSLNQFRKIEHLLSTDLDNWLCNLYFQVKRLPRGNTGVPECSFTLQIPSHPQLSSSQGLPPHPDTSTRSSASMPGRQNALLTGIIVSGHRTEVEGRLLLHIAAGRRLEQAKP